MQIEGWKYYNHAAIPTTAPHEPVNIKPINNGSIWQMGGGTPLLARWTTDWDCGFETNWWYCIRDGKFSLEELSPSSRKHIRQALKHNSVIRAKIEDSLYDDLYRVYSEATSHYELADNIQEKESFVSGLITREKYFDLFLAYNLENELLAYMTVRPEDGWVEIETAKFGDKALKAQSSNALYYTLLDYYLNEKKVQYVSSGSRSINHQTGTQEYKERVFGYRKAYCHLHIKYRPSVALLVKLVYPFRHVLQKHDSNTRIHQLNSVLKMEEMVRK